MTLAKFSLAFASAYLWIGFVSAISFMEAWLKFKAPGITLPLGLGIGKLIFQALNRVEWVFALSIAFSILFINERGTSSRNLWFCIALIVLLAQTFWALPALDVRAELTIQNEPIPPSNLHFYYIGMEIIKVTSLNVFAVLLLKEK